MLEFDSISVSSYEAGSLASQLTDKSAAGWQVVSIVSAGSSVTAYLSREAGSAADAGGGTADAFDIGGNFGTESTETPAAPVLEDTTVAPGSSIDEPVVDTPFSEQSAPNDTPSWGAVDVPAIDEPRVDTPAQPSEPAQTWQPDPAPSSNAVGSPTLADDVAALASQIESEQTVANQPAEEPGWASSVVDSAEPTLPATGTVAEPVSAPAAEPAPEPVPQPAAASAAPAGWYADPSTRYELRYWDGNQWTEHVSRAGQQYTDPPVA